jgi:hypothetical protein
MSKGYIVRQIILLKQGKITQSLHDARIAQYKLMRKVKREAKREASFRDGSAG